MPNEIDPKISSYVVELLKREEARLLGSDKSLPALIKISRTHYGHLTSGDKGVGKTSLKKIAEYFGRTVEDVVREAETRSGAANGRQREPTYVPSRHEDREARLSNVREKLLKRYDRASVNEVIAESEFVDGLNVSELEAFDRLDDILRMRKAEAKGKLITGKQEPHPIETPTVGPASRARKSSSTPLGADHVKLAEKRAESMRDVGRAVDRAKKKAD
jgi:hypothetical protein